MSLNPVPNSSICIDVLAELIGDVDLILADKVPRYPITAQFITPTNLSLTARLRLAN